MTLDQLPKDYRLVLDKIYEVASNTDFSIYLSITSIIISLFVLYRTIFYERFALKVFVRQFIEHPFDNPKINRLYIDLTFTNKSKLPISIDSVTLQVSGDTFEDGKPRKYSASHLPLEIYRSVQSGDNERQEKFYSDRLPINLGSLSSTSAILAFSMNDYAVQRFGFEKPILTIKTSRKTIKIPIEINDDTPTINISKWLVG